MAHSVPTMFRQTHPSIWEFIGMLKLHALYKRMLIAEILASAVLPPKKGSMGKLMLVSHHF